MADATIIEFVLAAWIEGLTDCVSQGVKVYPWGKAPQSTAPALYVLYRRIYGGRLRSLAGPSGVSFPRIQLDVFGRDYLAVRRLSAYIRESLEDLEAGAEMGGRTVQVAVAEDERDGDDTDPDQEPKHGGESLEHRAMIDLKIWFAEE